MVRSHSTPTVKKVIFQRSRSAVMTYRVFYFIYSIRFRAYGRDISISGKHLRPALAFLPTFMLFL